MLVVSNGLRATWNAETLVRRKGGIDEVGGALSDGLSSYKFGQMSAEGEGEDLDLIVAVGSWPRAAPPTRSNLSGRLNSDIFSFQPEPISLFLHALHHRQQLGSSFFRPPLYNAHPLIVGEWRLIDLTSPMPLDCDWKRNTAFITGERTARLRELGGFSPLAKWRLVFWVKCACIRARALLRSCDWIVCGDPKNDEIVVIRWRIEFSIVHVYSPSSVTNVKSPRAQRRFNDSRWRNKWESIRETIENESWQQDHGCWWLRVKEMPQRSGFRPYPTIYFCF